MTRQEQLVIETAGRGFTEITRQVREHVAASPVRTGLCHLFVQHTSASLIIGENADPDVLRDLEAFMSDRIPDGDPLFVHTAEGPDDMPAHVRSVLTATSLSVPVSEGELALGTWQGIFLWEHRHRGHRRSVILTLQGEPD
ncbi:MAG: YjbQ family protein [Chromatiales bacterium]|nr:YjbQ family protein [Chromatiales bacterium]